jgi:hypothetical protein
MLLPHPSPLCFLVPCSSVALGARPLSWVHDRRISTLVGAFSYSAAMRGG